jgi:small subunit ribosomal protein S17
MEQNDTTPETTSEAVTPADEAARPEAAAVTPDDSAARSEDAAVAQDETSTRAADSPEATAAAPAEEPAPAEDDAPAEVATAAETPAAPPAPKGEPQEVVAPKERRARGRAAKAAKVGVRPTRTPEERHAERVAERKQKAASRTIQRQRARAKTRAAGASTDEMPAREHPSGAPKTRQGTVVSNRADKTITVRIDVARRHRRYSKIVRTSSTLHAHDESNDANIGDTVVVRESRPLSRLKRWRLVEVVERAK